NKVSFAQPIEYSSFRREAVTVSENLNRRRGLSLPETQKIAELLAQLMPLGSDASRTSSLSTSSAEKIEPGLAVPAALHPQVASRRVLGPEPIFAPTVEWPAASVAEIVTDRRPTADRSDA